MKLFKYVKGIMGEIVLMGFIKPSYEIFMTMEEVILIADFGILSNFFGWIWI